MCNDLSKSLGAGKDLKIYLAAVSLRRLRSGGAGSWSCSSRQHNHKWAAPESTTNDRLITNKRLGPVTFFIAHFRCLQNFEISLHVELIPKASPTENKQRQQTPPYRKAVYQVLRAKFPTS